MSRPSSLCPRHLSWACPNTHAFISHPLRAAEPQEFALGPRPQRAPTRVVIYPPTHLLRAAEPQEFALGPRPQRPDQGGRSSPYPPTAGRRAAGVRPRSPATAPRLGSSFLSVPTHCGPPSRRSLPLVSGHSAPTRVVVPLRTHPLRAAEPQEFALGPRPQRPNVVFQPPTHLLQAAEPQEFALGPGPQRPD